MGSSQRVIPQAELDQGFGLLKDIIAIIKDPKAMEAAHEAAREQAQLTEAEQNKVIEARAFYSDADEKAVEYRTREDAIFSGEDELNRKKGEFTAHVESEELRLKNWETEIKNSNAALLTGLLQLEADQNALKLKASEQLAEHNRKMNELSEKITDVENTKKALQEEARATAVVKERLDNTQAEMLKLVTGKA